jgi:iron(III) transport system ATP-binding protein
MRPARSARAAAAAADGPIVRLSNVSKVFRRADGADVPAIEDTSLTVEAGEFLVLLGPSGCGKTTLLRSVAGLELPDRGRIEIFGRTVSAPEQGIHVKPEGRALSMIFQSYALWPHMTVFRNVAYPLASRRGARPSRAEVAVQVRRVLDMVGIGALADRYPHQMSGGQQQRVALARALVGGSRLVLFDEPLSNVDAKVREQLRLEMRSMQLELGFAAIYVTHDQGEAMQLADRIAVIDSGRVLQIGPPRELYEHPRSRFVANFIGTSNEITGTVDSVEGGQARVATDIGVVTATATGDLAAGDRAVAFWRPERCHVGTEPAAGANHWRGRLSLSAFVGAHVENVVEVGGNTFRQWTADTVPRSPGEELWFSVDPRDVRALPDHP